MHDRIIVSCVLLLSSRPALSQISKILLNAMLCITIVVRNLQNKRNYGGQIMNTTCKTMKNQRRRREFVIHRTCFFLSEMNFPSKMNFIVDDIFIVNKGMKIRSMRHSHQLFKRLLL